MNAVQKEKSSFIQFDDLVSLKKEDLSNPVNIKKMRIVCELIERQFYKSIPEVIKNEIKKDFKEIDDEKNIENNSRKIKLLKIAFNNLAFYEVHSLAMSVLGYKEFSELYIARSNDLKMNEKFEKYKIKQDEIEEKINFHRGLKLNRLGILRFLLLHYIAHPNSLDRIHSVNSLFIDFTIGGVSYIKNKKELTSELISSAIPLFSFLQLRDLNFQKAEESINDFLSSFSTCLYFTQEVNQKILKITDFVLDCIRDRSRILYSFLLCYPTDRKVGITIELNVRDLYYNSQDVLYQLSNYMQEALSSVKFIKEKSNICGLFSNFIESQASLEKTYRALFKKIQQLQHSSTGMIDLRKLDAWNLREKTLPVVQKQNQISYIQFREEYIRISKLASNEEEDNIFYQFQILHNQYISESQTSLQTIIEFIFNEHFHYLRNLNIFAVTEASILSSEELKIRSKIVSSFDILVSKFFNSLVNIFKDISKDSDLLTDEYLSCIVKANQIFSLVVTDVRKIKENQLATIFDPISQEESTALYESVNSIISLIQSITTSKKDDINICTTILEMCKSSIDIRGGSYFFTTPLDDKQIQNPQSERKFFNQIKNQIITNFSHYLRNYVFSKLVEALNESHTQSRMPYSYRISCIKWIKEYQKYAFELFNRLENLKDSTQIESIKMFIKIWKEHEAYIDTIPDLEEITLFSEALETNWGVLGYSWNQIKIALFNFNDLFSIQMKPLIKFVITQELTQGKRKKRRGRGQVKQISSAQIQIASKPFDKSKTEKVIAKSSSQKITSLSKEKEKEVNASDLSSRSLHTAVEKITLIENFCHRIPQLFFNVVNPTKEEVFLQQFKQEAAANLSLAIYQLHEILLTLKETLSPSQVVNAHLMIALSIEQALKLIMASKDVYASETNTHILLSQENFPRRLIDQHQLSQLLRMLEEVDETLGQSLLENDHQYIQTLDLFIPLTSRYELFGDSIMEPVQALREVKSNEECNIKTTLLIQWFRDSVEEGVDIIVKILNVLDRGFLVESEENRGLIKRALPDLSLIPFESFKEEPKPLEILQSIAKELVAIRLIRQETDKNKIISLEKESREQLIARRRQTEVTLNRLEKGVAALEEALLQPFEVGACLSSSKYLFLKCAVIMEQASLLLLNHLPISIPGNPSDHILCMRTQRGVFKHTHSITTFIESLRKYAFDSDDKTLQEITKQLFKHAPEMELFLKQLYRYHFKGESAIHTVLQTLEQLSLLRMHTIDENPALDNRIHSFVKTQVITPIHKILIVIDECIKYYLIKN